MPGKKNKLRVVARIQLHNIRRLPFFFLIWFNFKKNQWTTKKIFWLPITLYIPYKYDLLQVKISLKKKILFGMLLVPLIIY